MPKLQVRQSVWTMAKQRKIAPATDEPQTLSLTRAVDGHLAIASPSLGDVRLAHLDAVFQSCSTQEDDRDSMVQPGEGMTVMLAIRNEITRYGLERMLMSLPKVGKVEVRTFIEDGINDLREGIFDLFVAMLDESDQFELPDERGETKTLFIMDCFNPDDVVRAASTPADGFLDVRDLRKSSLDEALRKIQAGEVPMPVKLLKSMFAVVRNRRSDDHVPLTRLTPREQEVLSLLVQGMSNKQIATCLGISSHGVKRLVSNILYKFNCPNRTLAVAKALRENLYQKR
jgi:two-component system, NarL family, nitrate/nitrite response regulator NarL